MKKFLQWKERSPGWKTDFLLLPRNAFFANRRELLKTPMQFPALDGTALMAA